MILLLAVTAEKSPWIIQPGLWLLNLKAEEGPCIPVPWAGCGVVAVGAGFLSWALVDPDSFVLPQQLNAAQRRVQDLWKLHPAPGAVICQTWLLWLTLASSSA